MLPLYAEAWQGVFGSRTQAVCGVLRKRRVRVRVAAAELTTVRPSCFPAHIDRDDSTRAALGTIR